ncbi:ccmH/CycL/Ccl2/NrfF family [Artemisia annua]|uniref:CcmH/CycL/Ccl2/NrfF family n=1 Tax=Artemisia annua TaxID=35608 RepID=A0A2U1NJ15_ARTAN|nr:ccmH/CycL/Ccl2/NrfF family [Artemisia annua]
MPARNISHNVKCLECGSESIEECQADIVVLLRKVSGVRFGRWDGGRGDGLQVVSGVGEGMKVGKGEFD